MGSGWSFSSSLLPKEGQETEDPTLLGAVLKHPACNAQNFVLRPKAWDSSIDSDVGFGVLSLPSP